MALAWKVSRGNPRGFESRTLLHGEVSRASAYRQPSRKRSGVNIPCGFETHPLRQEGMLTVMPSEAEKAWAAGILDADGCVSMRPPSGGRFRHPYLVVDSTDREILEELERVFGGRIVPKKTREGKGWRQQWSWRIFGARNILVFLGQVVPYMHCPSKVTRAQMLLHEYPVVTQRNGQYTEEQREAKLDLEERFMAVGHGRGASLRALHGSVAKSGQGTRLISGRCGGSNPPGPTTGRIPSAFKRLKG